MLSEIYCEHFQQKTITFHKGLNVVLGSCSGDNSIGKSTLLLIIDFVFGGNTYAKSKDVLENVGEHEIKFKFVFNNEPYCFSRTNNDDKKVWKCDYEYNKIEPISLADYLSWLDIQYHIQLCDLSFRSFVSRFMRIYGKDNYDERLPLKSFSNDKMRDSILTCLKIFNKYSEIKDAEVLSKQAQEEFNAFKKAIKFNFVPNINKTEYKANLKLIDDLKGEIGVLSNDLENNLLDTDSEITDEIIKARNELSKLKQQRYHILNKIRNISLNEDYSFSKTNKDFEILKTFFPNVNLKRVEEIESFHKQISIVFKKQASEEKSILNRQLEDVNDSIKQLENKLIELSNNPKLSTVVLQKHSDLINRIEKMEKENETFLQQKELKGNKDMAAKSLEEIKSEQLKDIEIQLNSKMNEINTKIYGRNASSPIIHFSSDNYSFYTPNDTGTGIAHKGLIVFDLAVAHLTRVPALIHDSILLKQISNDAFTNILKQYEKCNKQVFIAFDKQNTYGEDALSILERNYVIKLSHGGHELFGKYWGDKKEASKQ